MGISIPTVINDTQRLVSGDGGNLKVQTKNLLETFIPGYNLVHQLVLHLFGFDIGLVFSVGLFVFGVVSGWCWAWNRTSSLFFRLFTSSVYIDEGDDLFDAILGWIAQQRMAKASRSVKAVTVYGSSYDFGDGENADEALDDSGIFHFAKWAAKAPPRYEPYYGSHRFWHRGRLFFFDRSRRDLPPNVFSGRSDEQLIELTCVGRSTTAIKELLEHVKIWSLEKEKSLTVIRRPAGKDRARWAGAWDRVSSRPSRPMDTVSLDPEQKREIVDDINEYLHPSSPRWYATRGIPYRRGYLFHGPPGTGKTSLSFALAGIFGLDIYVISLLEPTLTEADLNRLFNNLPRRCIVLLEDIDTAGLLRDEKTEGAQDDGEGNGRDETLTAANLAKAIKSANRSGKNPDENKQTISLSGLLNAIDGVATHEGRVLVMTTNHPEQLDEALIRPGRVDMQVKFTLATRDQIRDIFIRMYSTDRDALPKDRIAANGSAARSASPEKHANGYARLPNGVPCANGDVKKHGRKDSGVSIPQSLVSESELRSIAVQFASRLPEDKFSPAEIQGFLLTRKKEPYRALREVGEWQRSLLEAKEKKAKVMHMN